jgi:hypothetical protein
MFKAAEKVSRCSHRRDANSYRFGSCVLKGQPRDLTAQWRQGFPGLEGGSPHRHNWLHSTRMVSHVNATHPAVGRSLVTSAAAATTCSAQHLAVLSPVTRSGTWNCRHWKKDMNSGDRTLISREGKTWGMSGGTRSALQWRGTVSGTEGQ